MSIKSNNKARCRANRAEDVKRTDRAKSQIEEGSPTAIAAMLGLRPVDLRRMDARAADVERLRGEVRKFFKIGGFDWQKRYDAVYLGKYARAKKWQLSRLTRAVETLDLEWRIAVNHQRGKNERGER